MNRVLTSERVDEGIVWVCGKKMMWVLKRKVLELFIGQT
jgi:hypothetical protein